MRWYIPVLAFLFAVTGFSSADGGRIFSDSKAVYVSRWRVVEESNDLPMEIMPAYIGSGLIGLGVDASGLQGLDSRLHLNPKFGKPEWSHADDIYVFHERMISSHITPNNLMPLAYLAYSLVIDGKNVDIADSTIRWTRETNLRDASVRTVIRLRSGVELSIFVFSPYRSSTVWVKFGSRSIDGKKHALTLRPEMRIRLRQRSGSGQILEKTAKITSAGQKAYLTGQITAKSPAKPHEDYKVTYGIVGPAGAKAQANDSGLSLSIDLSAGVKQNTSDVSFEFYSSAAKDKSAARHGNLDDALREHKADWAKFYDSGAQIFIGNPRREFLYNNSLYLLRSGSTYRSGLPLEILLFHPENWYGATFWDTDFVLDGFIKANQLDPSLRMLKWFNQTVRPTGRPFPWMMWYDGKSAAPEGSIDNAVFVSASHAMCGIRLYETTGDIDLLKSEVYPLVRRVAVYAAEEGFTREGNHYIQTGAGGDMNTPPQLNDTYTAVWLATVMKKAAEYSELLETDDALRAKWNEITEGLKLEYEKNYYVMSRNSPYVNGWVPMLLYPTEAAPMIDMELMRNTRNLSRGVDRERFSQPWVAFWQAASDLRMGHDHADAAERSIAIGVEYTHGPGYFAEGLVRGQPIEGLPPYVTAHGSYLTASAEQLAIGSIWSNQIGLFVNLPTKLKHARVSFERIRTANGALVSGRYTPKIITAELSGSGKYRLGVIAPAGARGSGIVVNVDGTSVGYNQHDGCVYFDVTLRKSIKCNVTVN